MLLTLLIAFTVAARSQPAPSKFIGAREDYPYDGSFAIGDFNGDGFPDIATSDAAGRVVTLLNDGTGHFKESAAIRGGPEAHFAVGDFNNDGLLDLAFNASGFIYIALGTGDGTLRIVSRTITQSSGDLKVIDLDGDGNLDVVSGDFPVSYLLGYGDGTLHPPVMLQDLHAPFAVADVNGDGKPDVVGTTPAALVVEVNQGDGTFTPGPFMGFPAEDALALAVGDIDGNSTTDLVVATFNPSQILILKGDGHGGFLESSSIPLEAQVKNLALLDINGDGKLDLLYDRSSTSQQLAANLAINLGNGDGTFQMAIDYATAGASDRILQADTRKSGHLDLLTGGKRQFSVLPNKGDGTFYQGAYFYLDGILGSTVIGDFNHDGINDLAVSVRRSTQQNANTGSDPRANSQLSGAYILLGTGRLDQPYSGAQRLYISPDVLDVVTADFNNDGNPDLAFVTGQDLVIYLGAGDGTFVDGPQYPCVCSKLTVGDFNGDNRIDIATSGVFVYLGNGDGTFASPTLPFMGGDGFIGTADLSGDGNADLIASQRTSISFTVGFGDGRGGFKSSSVAGDSNVTSAVLADFNNDGQADLAVLSGPYVDIFLNQGAGSLIKANSFNVELIGFMPQADTIFAFDFNHDGFLDIATPGIDIQIYPGNGDGTFSLPHFVGSANYPNVIVNSGSELLGIGLNGTVSYFYNEFR